MSDRTPKDQFVVVATYEDRIESWAYDTEPQADQQDRALREQGTAKKVIHGLVRRYRGERHRVVTI
jgi:hypothetical protein